MVFCNALEIPPGKIANVYTLGRQSINYEPFVAQSFFSKRNKIQTSVNRRTILEWNHETSNELEILKV